MTTVGCVQTHGYRCICLADSFKIQVFTQQILILSFKTEVQRSILSVKQDEWLFLLIHVLLQHSLLHASSLVRESQLKQIIFQGSQLLCSLGSLIEHGSRIQPDCLFCSFLRFESFLLLLDRKLLDRVLIVLCTCFFFLTGTVVDAEADNDRSDQDETY